MDKNEKFDPNDVGVDNGNYFGLPFPAEDCRIVLISVPWDVTTSYGGGASYAPDAIIGASTQVDLYDKHFPNGWKQGIGTVGINYSIQESSTMLRAEAKKVIAHLESGRDYADDYFRRKRNHVNEGSAILNDKVEKESLAWLSKGKIVGLVGGDHSVPYGLLSAISIHHGNFGILHIDAHADLRECYEGFDYSHASIMYNVMSRIKGVDRLVQVALRDYCDQEVEFAAADDRIVQFDDYMLAQARFQGITWHEQCEKIVEQLPDKVYISFDIDGLSPEHCPNTGTPVAGGLSFHEAVYLINLVVESGRRIVGFDLCEVSPGCDSEWDANVGARILYKLCNLTLKSNR